MIESVGSIIGSYLGRIAGNKREKPNDFEKDGILYCGECGEAKQAWIDWMPDADGNPVRNLLPVMCRCDREEYDAQEAENRKKQFAVNLAAMRDRYGIQSRVLEKPTFDRDDNPNSPISRTCRRYVDEWDEMKKNNLGIIFFGSKGTGKSFYAACIANELAKRQVTTAMTTTALIMGIMQGTFDKAGVLDNINHFALLVLDDLGAERSTEFGAEMMYNIIDSRYRSKLPLIVTTNLDIEDMKSETEMWRSRIYDRVLEMCAIPLKMQGESRRTEIADERRNLAREFLRNSGKEPSNGN